MKCSNRSLLGTAIAIVFTAILGNSAMAQNQGGTLVMIVQPEPPTLASYLSTSGPIGQVAAKVYDGLLEYDTELQPKPSLAESWSVSSDGKTISFKLRKGVVFHDGAPLTSADVQFSIMKVAKVTHPSLHDDGFLRLRDADHPQAYFRQRRPSHPCQRQ
jgi:peptide/nickel transport system substrate-binding protein